MQISLNKPILCTVQEKKALAFLLTKIQDSEPASCIGIKGMGKDIIYEELVARLAKEQLPFSLITKQPIAANELEEIIQSIEAETSPLLCILNLCGMSDLSEYIVRLDNLREKRGPNFICIIFSTISQVYESLASHNKLISRGLFILLPLTKQDSITLLSTFSKRFGYKPSVDIAQKLITLSGGHVGLLKALYLLAREDAKAISDIAQILDNNAVLSRIQAILTDIDKIKPKSNSAPLLEKIGYQKKGEPFSPLISAFINKAQSLISDPTLLFTPSQKAVFIYLANHLGELVDKDTIARLVWGELWEEKYSDWAIDQLLHNIREKLKSSDSRYSLKTKKGQGVVLQDLVRI